MTAKKRYLKAIPWIAFALLFWFLAPRLAVWSISLTSKKGERSSRVISDLIVFFGQRSIGPTISSIENNSPWRRRYCYLPDSLKRIGGKAHPELIEAIKKQEDPLRRAYLISTLQSAFEDYAYLDTLIEDVEQGRLSAMIFGFMRTELQQNFPKAPEPLTTENNLNPAFKNFWKTKK